MKNIKSALASMDDALLLELFNAAQFALNDEETIERVSDETGIPAARLEAMAAIFIDLSVMGDSAHPGISLCQTSDELDAMTNHLIAAQAEYEGG